MNTLRSFKTEINPTPEQKVKRNKTIGTCRYICNFYLAHNKALHSKGERDRIKIPTLGWVRLKEKGYIPTPKDGYAVKSGTVSMAGTAEAFEEIRGSKTIKK